MARILLCAAGKDLLEEVGPLVRKAHHLVIVPGVAGAVRVLLLSRFDAVVVDLDRVAPEDIPSLPLIAHLGPPATLFVTAGSPLPAVARALRDRAGRAHLLSPGAAGEVVRSLEAALGRRETPAEARSAHHADPALAAS